MLYPVEKLAPRNLRDRITRHVAARSLPPCGQHLPNRINHKLRLLELDVMAAVRGDHQLPIARHRRDCSMLLSVLLFVSLPIGALFLGSPAGQDDQRHVAEWMLGLDPLSPQAREFFG